MDIRSIIQILEGNEKRNKMDSLYLRFFKNIDVLYTYSWRYKRRSDIRFHVRDSAMAENFIWLKEKGLFGWPYPRVGSLPPKPWHFKGAMGR